MDFAPLYRSRPPSKWTNGDIAARVGADLGLPPDEEQRWILDTIFAEKAPDRPAAFEFWVVGPRQNIKTSTLGIASLSELFVPAFGVKRQIWSSHLLDTSKSTFNDFKTWIESNHEYADLVDYYEGHQDLSIYRRDDPEACIEFRARTGKGGRGLTGVKRVTLDEALFLEPKHVGAVFPTMLTRPGAQVRGASSAGLEISAQLRAVRERGRTGTDPVMAYLEYGARRRHCEDDKCLHVVGTPGCALDDRSLWWEANCALWSGRITEESLENMRNSMPPAEFMREFFSWWEDPLSLGGAIKPARWADARDDSLTQPDDIPAIGLAGSPDGLFGSIGSAAILADGRTALAPVDRRRGQRWLIDEAARIQKARSCAVAVATRGPIAHLIPDLEDAGVVVTQLESSEWVDACETLWQGVEGGTVAHTGDKELTESALSAAWKTVGDRRAFSRKGDISLLEAVVLAAHVARHGRASVYESRGLVTL